MSFDYESYQSLNIRVKAMDGNNSSVEGAFTVIVTNQNEAPNGLDHLNGLSVLENQASGTIVGTFQAIDPDGDDLSYQLVSGSGDGNNSMFTMDTNGTLRTAVSFDYESYQSLNIRVKAMDGNNSPVEGAFTVVILNDLGSVFSVSGGSLSYPFYQFVDGNGLAIDFSSHQLSRGEIYEFKADGVLISHPFMIGESNGDLSSSLVSSGPVTGSQGSIFLTIPSDFSGSLYYFCTVHTSMVAPIGYNTGNQAPTNLTYLNALAVLENQSSGTIVGTFQAQDPDGDDLSYHLVSGSGDGNNSMFTMDTDGTLRTAMSFDYELYQGLNIRVKAMDGNSSSVEGAFIVAVTNVNETPTALDHLSALTVLENQASGTIVGTFKAQDPDGDDLSYHLVSGSGDGNNSMFTMDTNGTLRTAMTFDYESYQSVSIRVGTMDEKNASMEGSFTVSILDVNESLPNSPPENLSAVGNLEILENQPIGSFICEFNATDLDGDTLSYYLVNGDGDINNEMFTLDQNGTLRTNQIFDYESNVVLSIRVQVADDKSGTISESFVVKILDEDDLTINEPPRDLNSTEELNIAENQPVGTVVGQFHALDPEGTTLTYFLTDDAGIYDNDSFVLETNGTLKTAVEFDFENQNMLTIRVAVQDLSNSSITEVFNVEILDVNETTPNEAPVNLRALNNLEVEENQPIGSIVGEFNASDPEGEEVFFFLTSGESDDHNAMFYILGNQLRTNSVFDYALFSSLTIRVGAMDESNAITDSNFTVKIIESTVEPVNLPPTDLFAIDITGVSNNSVEGDVIGEFNATDPEGGSLFFSLMEENENNDNEYFAITENGILKLVFKLSFDLNRTFDVDIKVADDADQITSKTFLIPYTFMEDNSSELPFYFDSTTLEIEENQPVGSIIGSFYTVSGIGLEETVEYSFTTEDSRFLLDKNGSLKSGVIFDFEEMNEGTIAIEVVGLTSEKQMTIRQFQVEIIDQNETLPEHELFDFNLSSRSISEDANIGSLVGTFIPDMDDTSLQVEYFLNDPNSLFEIVDESLVTRVELDYDKLSYYNLSVDVLAMVNFQEVKFRSFTISLENVNYAPEEISINDELHIIGNEPETHQLGPFIVTDKDESDEHGFQLVNGLETNDNHLFSLDENGTLYFINEDSFGTKRDFTIILRASDNSGAYIDQVFTIKYEETAGDAAVLLTDGVEIQGGWKRAGWFGYFYGEFYPWVHHENLGWVYIEQNYDNTWLYRDGLGWGWTNHEFFPFIYLVDRNYWVYLDRNYFPAALFDYGYQEWFQPDRLYRVSTTVSRSVGGEVTGSGTYRRWEKVKVFANPEFGFKFSAWTGDIESIDHELEIEVHRDIQAEAVFLPDVSSGISTDSSLRSFIEYVEALDELTEEEKKQAVTDLFLYGEL